MRLGTIVTGSGPRAVVLRGESVLDLALTDPTLPNSVRGILDMGAAGLRRAEAVLGRGDATAYELAKVKFMAPVPDPRKIICLGLNYRDHAAESGAQIPKEPVLFSKYATALTGHECPIVLPPVSSEVDYEAELVIVVGQRGRPRSAAEAKDFIAGYTIGHDVSARDWQLKKDQRQWMAGKTFDTFAPTGPFVVTADELPEPLHLDMALRLNGRVMQSSNTRQMVFGPEAVIAYLAQIMTLEAGDLIFTGTPPGVGFVRKPPIYLQPGDVVEIEIEKLGVLRNIVTR